jgi:hypothetical protein
MPLKKDSIIFEFLCFVIAIISAIDLYFIGKTRTIIQESEENPIGQYLIVLDNGDISLFMATKFLGTMLALYILFKLHRLQFKHILLVTSVIAIAQILLLIYLFI